jgi:hypothetical protein
LAFGQRGRLRPVPPRWREQAGGLRGFAGKKKKETPMEQMNKDRIRQRAYEIWEAAGRPEGRQDEHWQQALAEITAKDAYGLDPQAEPLPQKGRRARSS